MATIQGIYIALFGRPADPIGLDYFNTATSNGANLNAIGDLASTAEYQTRFQGMDSVEIITAIYQSLFARNPEQEGLTFFVNALAAGTYSINNVAIAVLDGAQGPDLDIVRNKIAAATVFTKAIDTGDELAAYRGNDAADAGRAFITPVTGDDDTIPTADEADAALAPLVNGSSKFVLSEGYDTANSVGAFTDGGPGDTGTKAGFKFTEASESITATSATLGRFDSLIDATTTDNDHLQLTLTGDTVFGVTKNIETLEVNANTESFSSLSLALVAGAKTLDITGLLNGHLTITDAFNSGITVVDGSGLVSAQSGNGFEIDFLASAGTAARDITGSAADDTLKGGAGDDMITGGEGDDQLYGGAGNDTLIGGGGVTNTLVGGAGNDILRGGAGGDYISADGGTDTIIGGAGLNQIFLAQDYLAGAVIPDGATDTVVFEASNTGINSILLFEATGAGADRLDVSAFLGAPVAFEAVPTKSIGAVAAGFDGSAFNVIILAKDENIDSQSELTASIGNDPGDLKLAPNAHVVVGYQDDSDTRLYFVTTNAAGEATDIALVGLLASTTSADLTATNFI